MRYRLLFLGIALASAPFRFARLAERPMHSDEAVNADRVGTLLDHGRYEYSAVDFHGPTLFYLSALAARVQGAAHYIDLKETTLRVVPALVGVLLVAAHYFLIPYLGLAAAAWAAIFTALSPAMVFYSRYFIHENLLVFLTFCAMLSLLHRKPVLAGVFLGLMFATKETFVIALFCMAAALLVDRKPGTRALLSGVAAFVVTAALFMSSFFVHPRGLVDSILAYGNYFRRGLGSGTPHIHPWYFYFDRLVFFNGPSETFVVLLAIAGFAMAWKHGGVARFLAIYTALMIAIYSALPYKVPWNALGFLHGMILLAGIAVATLLKDAPKLAIPMLVLGVAFQSQPAFALGMDPTADPHNPWVYAHTGRDVYKIRDCVAAAAAVDPAGKKLAIQIFTHDNLWPLPWYLRPYPEVRWWNGVSDTAPLAPLILATPDMEPALLHRMYDIPPPGQREMYVNLFDRYTELRPRVEVRMYVTKSLSDEIRGTQ